MVSITSPQPTSSPIGTIHHPSTSCLFAGTPPNPSRIKNERSLLLFREIHNPVVCEWNGFNSAQSEDPEKISDD